MAGYKEPSFQERTAAATRARETALAKLRAKPPLDEAALAERAARNAAREAAEAEKRRLRQVAKEEAEAAKLAEIARAEQEAADLIAKAARSEIEKKEARDARYAARKNRR